MNGNANFKNTPVAVLDKVVVVVPDFRQWTGTRAMHEGDFVIGANGKLPPKEVTKSLGLKAVIDPLTLRVFGRIKHQADAVLEGCGVRFLSGWAVPEGKAAEVFAELDGIVARYNDEKMAFLASYDANVSDWAARNPGFSREILEGKVDIAAVAERISAGYEAFRLQPVTASGAQALANRVGGLGGELIADIAQIARNFFKESFLGKSRANRKTVNAVLKLRERLNGLSFLSNAIQPLVDMIDRVVAQVPPEGYFEGEAYWKLATLVKTLGDESLLEEIIRKQVSVDGLPQSGTASPAPNEAEELPVAKPQETAQAEPVQEQTEEIREEIPDPFQSLEAFFVEDKSDEETPVQVHDEEMPPALDTTDTAVTKCDEQTLDVNLAESSSEQDRHEDSGDMESAEKFSSGAIPAMPPAIDIGEGMYF